MRDSQGAEFAAPCHPPPRLHSSRHRSPLLLSLSSLAFLTACGGGGEEEGLDLSSYLPILPAPLPLADTVLSAGLTNLPLNILSQIQDLLASPAYQGTRVTVDFVRFFDPDLSSRPYALQSSGAAFAHALKITGKGALIAITGEHISPGHEAFGDRVDTISNGPSVNANGDLLEHGTSVASVAIGRSPTFVGTAPDAEVIFGSYGADSDLVTLGQLALAEGAVAWNNSWGFVNTTTGSTVTISQQSVDGIFGDPGGQAYLTALRNYAAEGVVVFASSNITSDLNAGVMDALPYVIPDLEAGWIAAVNGVPTFSGSTVTAVSLISAPCWEAARWCLIADGSWNAAVGPASAFEFTTGTSFAAPQISGALALLAEAFPDLASTPHALRVRLLASAEDDFFAPDATIRLADGFFKDYSVIYGHGFLDIEAALKPIGGTAFTTPNGNSISTDAPVLLTGSGFGDAIEISLAGTDVAVRDALAAGFAMPAGALTAGARPGSQAGALLVRSLTGNLAAERKASPAALATPFAAFAGPVMTLTSPDGSGNAAVLLPQTGSEAMGFTLTGALVDGDTRVDIGLKLARDDGQIMSLGGQGGANMASVTLGFTQDLGNGGFMALSGELGTTDIGGATALSRATSARFDALKLSAGSSNIFTSGDRLSVGVGMPVAIASGETVLDLPVVREGLAASFESVALDLAPEDRQLDLELTYQTALADGLEMKLSLVHSDNFGNRAGETDTGGALAFAFRF